MDIQNAKQQNMGGERFLSFSLGSEEYAVPLLAVREVIAMPEYTPVPYTATYFLGIMNLRGQIISVMDLRQKLNIKPNPNVETAVIICDLNGISIGVVVDSVNSVLNPAASEISEKPEIQSNRPTDYITAVYRKDKKLVLFLDIAKSLSVEDHNALRKTAGAGEVKKVA
jgi:purine-binding chemotaxis protein CheW